MKNVWLLLINLCCDSSGSGRAESRDPRYLLGPAVPIGTCGTYWDPQYLPGPAVPTGTHSTYWDLQYLLGSALPIGIHSTYRDLQNQLGPVVRIGTCGIYWNLQFQFQTRNCDRTSRLQWQHTTEIGYLTLWWETDFTQIPRRCFCICSRCDMLPVAVSSLRWHTHFTCQGAMS